MASNTPRIDRLQKNYLINGDMRIAQRGTSFAAIASGAYSLDRFRYSKSGAMVHTLTQDTDVPTLAEAGYLFQNSLRLNLTTPDTSIATTDNMSLDQLVEGYNWANLAQKDFTLSFWVKATLAGTYCVAFRNSGADRSYIAEYTINSANTWEKKVLHISASTSAGTWNYTNGVGLDIRWVLASGTNFHTTPNAWQAGNFIATVNQVNGTNTGATDFRITGAMLSEGHLVDPEFCTFGKDLLAEVQACQRYYEKTYDLTTNPASITTVGAHRFQTGPNGLSRDYATYKVMKRTNANSITYYNSSTGATGQFQVTGVGGISIVTTINGFHGLSWESAGTSANTDCFVHWATDAEL